MAIKFGDTLENQNTDYPIVDVVGDNIAGVHIIDDFANDHLIAIPASARRTGSIVIAKDTGKAYIYKGGTTTGNNNSGNEWGHPAGTNWIAVGTTPDGSIELGSSVTLNDNTVAASIDSNTTVVSAIDQLNEILGLLVPTAPQAWTAFESSLTASTAFSGLTTSNNARLVPRTAGGALITHALNGSGATQPGASGEVAVKWETDTSFSNTITIGTNGQASDNNLAQTTLIFKLNDESVSMGSATQDATQTTNSSYAGNITINADFANFPNTGSSSDGFYQGIHQIAIAATATLADGYHKFALEDASGNGVDLLIYKAADEASPSIGTNNASLTAAGDNIWQSGQKYFTRPTLMINSIVAVNLIPTTALVYGVTSTTTNNNFLSFTAGTLFGAFNSKSYTDISSITTTADLKQGQDGAFGSGNFSGNAQTAAAGTTGGLLLTATSNVFMPTTNNLSIHGNAAKDLVVTATDIGTSTRFMFYDQGSESYSSTSTYVSEDKLFNGLHSTSASNPGVRVKDPDVGGTYEDDPAGAQSLYAAWNTRYGNNSSSSFAIDAADAVVAVKASANSNSIANMRIAHEVRNFTTLTAYKFAADAQNFSTRTAGDIQYVTYRFPVNTSGLQFIYLKFQGSLTSTGDGFVKIFDTGQTPSIVDANTGTNGWLKLTAAAVASGGVATGGATTGGVLSKTSTSAQTITLTTSGTQRWGNGAAEGGVSYVYLRFKLPQNAYIEQLALNTSSF